VLLPVGALTRRRAVAHGPAGAHAQLHGCSRLLPASAGTVAARRHAATRARVGPRANTQAFELGCEQAVLGVDLAQLRHELWGDDATHLRPLPPGLVRTQPLGGPSVRHLDRAERSGYSGDGAEGEGFDRAGRGAFDRGGGRGSGGVEPRANVGLRILVGHRARGQFCDR
jgi:hypothetical protein